MVPDTDTERESVRQQNLLLASEADRATQGSQKHGVFVWIGGGWSRSIGCYRRTPLDRPEAKSPGPRPARRRTATWAWLHVARDDDSLHPAPAATRRRTCLAIRCLAPHRGRAYTHTSQWPIPIVGAILRWMWTVHLMLSKAKQTDL